MSHSDAQNSPRQSPSPIKNGLTLPPINAIKSYLNSPVESPRGSPRVGLDMSLMIGSTPDIKALSVRGSRPHNISIDSSICKLP